MVKASERAEVDELLGLLLDGAELDAAQGNRLQSLLLSNPELLDQFVLTTALANDLQQVASLAVSADGESRTLASSHGQKVGGLMSRALRASALAVAASLFFVGVSLWLQSPGGADGTPRYSVRTEFVATVVSQEGWSESTRYPAGSRIPTGVFALDEGVVQLQLDSGPNLFLEGPARLDIQSGSRATIAFGKLVFRDDSGGDPFLLSTTWSEFIDLGTEYAVSVTSENEEVHVFSGAVERRGIAEGTRMPAELLSNGQAMRYTHNASPLTVALATEPEKFVREVDLGQRILEQPVVASEFFDYTDDSCMMENTADGGRGWASPWRRNVPDFPGYNKDDLALRVSDSLFFSSHSEASRGGSLGYVGHWFTHRELSEPIDLGANRVFYLSFLYRPTGMWSEGENSLRLLFFNPGEGVIEHRIAIALDAGRGVIRGALCGARRQCPLPMTEGATYLVVAKIACSTDNPDQLMLRVYQPSEPVRSYEPANWTVVTPSIASDDSFSLMSLLFNCDHEQRIDEIRVGRTWSSVVQSWLSRTEPIELSLNAAVSERD